MFPFKVSIELIDSLAKNFIVRFMHIKLSYVRYTVTYFTLVKYISVSGFQIHICEIFVVFEWNSDVAEELTFSIWLISVMRDWFNQVHALTLILQTEYVPLKYQCFKGIHISINELGPVRTGRLGRNFIGWIAANPFIYWTGYQHPTAVVVYGGKKGWQNKYVANFLQWVANLYVGNLCSVPSLPWKF
jgi:hypothetical protein